MKRVWAMGMLIAVAVCGVAQASEPPTFSDEVVRIVQERCQTCHRPGEHAPFSLITYADVYKHRADIRDQIEWRTMPPWKPVPGFGSFLESRRLSDTEVATILKWIDAGAPEGDRAKLPPPRVFPTGWALGPPDHVPSARKLAAFERAAAGTNGGPLPAELVERTRFSIEGGHAAAGRLIARGVTGIICASDPLALGAIRAARRAGLSVPADLSVIGYDDSALMSCTDPPLTTVRQPIEAIGRAAVEMLAGQIEGSVVSADELFFEPEVVARGSTAYAPVAV